jgi:hypothetical protein
MKTKVYFTVDTESSMGGAWANPRLRPVPAKRRIYCDQDGESLGIGWICRELNQRGQRATFFAEVFGSMVHGEDETREWIQYLLGHGQDVQLHAHLNFYFYALQSQGQDVNGQRTDNLADLEGHRRLELLREGCRLFRSAAGYDPTVFRAGSWRCHKEMLRDLAAVGIVLDASFNRTEQGRGSFDRDTVAINKLQNLDGIWEFPITVAHQTLPDRAVPEGLRPFDPTSMSAWEMRKVLNDAHAAGMQHVSAVFHSFSGVKASDVQYLKIRPDHVVRGRFQGLLDFIARNDDRFEMATMGELASTLGKDGDVHFDRTSVSELGFVRPLARKIVQVFNRLI